MSTTIVRRDWEANEPRYDVIVYVNGPWFATIASDHFTDVSGFSLTDARDRVARFVRVGVWFNATTWLPPAAIFRVDLVQNHDVGAVRR